MKNPQNPALEGSEVQVQPQACCSGRAGGSVSSTLGGSVLSVLWQHMDHYSRTKAIADQLILTANGTPLPGKNCGPAHSKYVAPSCFAQNVCVVLAFS